MEDLIIIQEDPERMPAVSVSSSTLSTFVRQLVRAFVAAGATPEEIFKAYAPSIPVWNLPPRAVEGQKPVPYVRMPHKCRTLQQLCAFHTEVRKLVTYNGVGPRFHGTVQDMLGPRCYHPLVFTQTPKGVESANLFTLEFLLNIEDSDSYLDVESGAIRRVFPRKAKSNHSLRLSERISPLATPAWIRAKLYGPRGQIIYDTFDILDKMLIWAKANTTDSTKRELLNRLAWLKVQQSPELAYYVEQQVYAMQPEEPLPVDKDYGNLMYTMDILDTIRSLWIDSEKSDHGAFRDLYDYLVPSYMDDDRFRSFFGSGMVFEEDYVPEIGRRVDAGMLNFSAKFAAIAMAMEKVR